MGKRIAVARQLSPVKAYLQAKGYEVVELGANVEADAVVVSGQDENMLGMEIIDIQGPVINAEGLSPEEVYQEIKSRYIPEAEE
ncbi:MAG: YkuS family protein [bacterium]|jgi:hypothetical protein